MTKSIAAILAVLGLASRGALPAAGELSPRRPSILFILVDDYGLKHVGIEGSTIYETPNIDALARGGMRFTQGYASCQVCSASRASILLGQHPTRHGISDYIGADVGEAFAKQRHTKLRPAACVRNLPAADTTLAEALTGAGYPTFFAGKRHLGSKGPWPEDHGFDINKGGWDAGSPMGGYYAPWQNTIVCFTSDNGGVSSGDDFSSSELPHRGGKGRQWEGGVRVPFCIKAPGVTRPGSTCDTPVMHTDFYPTILQLAGLPLWPQHHVDGVSLVPLLNGSRIAARPLFWHYPHYGNQAGEPSSIVRVGDWKLIHYWEDGRNELYHLPGDIGEQRDLAQQEPARTSQLCGELQAWLTETGAKRPQPNPDYQEAWGCNRNKPRWASRRLDRQHADYLESDWQPDPAWWKSLTTKD